MGYCHLARLLVYHYLVAFFFSAFGKGEDVAFLFPKGVLLCTLLHFGHQLWADKGVKGECCLVVAVGNAFFIFRNSQRIVADGKWLLVCYLVFRKYKKRGFN